MDYSQMHNVTPLRYPGGKARIANFVMLLLRRNNLMDCHYVEPYAGGAGVALSLLFHEYASHVYINDIDPAVYAFWHSVLNATEDLCSLIIDTPVTVEEWQRQKEVQRHHTSTLQLGFSTFFLNRTNRSGILTAGIIGGREQTGNWKIDARFNKTDLIKRIRKIGRYRNRIHLFQRDAVALLQEDLINLPANTLIYLDPPYYDKAEGLYQNFYKHNDHVTVSQAVASLNRSWIVSYDNAAQIRGLYAEYRSIEYQLDYSAHSPKEGSEIIFFSDDLSVPVVGNPVDVTTRQLAQLTLFPD